MWVFFVSCRHTEDAQYFMLWSTLNFVDQLQNYPSKHLKSNALDSTSDHLWKVIPIFSQYFPTLSFHNLQSKSKDLAVVVRFHGCTPRRDFYLHVTICRGPQCKILSQCNFISIQRNNMPWTLDFIPIWQYTVALNGRSYPNAILSQYNVTICLGP